MLVSRRGHFRSTGKPGCSSFIFFLTTTPPVYPQTRGKPTFVGKSHLFSVEHAYPTNSNAAVPLKMSKMPSKYTRNELEKKKKNGDIRGHFGLIKLGRPSKATAKAITDPPPAAKAAVAKHDAKACTKVFGELPTRSLRHSKRQFSVCRLTLQFHQPLSRGRKKGSRRQQRNIRYQFIC